MKRLGVCIVTLLLVAGCGNTQSLTQSNATTPLDTSAYWYAASVADTSQCQAVMTISGGLKYKCAQ